MSSNAYSHNVKNGTAVMYMLCSGCSHYIGNHSKETCQVDGCDCCRGFYDLARDMRGCGHTGYVSEFSTDSKVGIRIENQVFIFDVIEAEELAKFILACADVAKMTTLPNPEKGES